MAKTLMAIQVEDAKLMAEGGDLPNYSLAGTGKTLSTLEAFRLAGHKKGIVLAPAIALDMWAAEIDDYLGASVQVIRKGADTLSKGNDFIVAPYDLAAGSQRTALYKAFNEGALILDEADRVRGNTSKRTDAVMGRGCTGRGGFIERADQVWSLTGNPIYRYHNDLWSQLVGLYPDLFAEYGVLEYDDFVKNFCFTKVKKFHPRMEPKVTILGSTNAPIIHHILHKEIGVIRRKVASDLPPVVEEVLHPKMTAIPTQYASMINNMTDAQLLRVLLAEEDEEAGLAGIWQAVAIAKVKGSVEYITDLCKATPVLIGTWHSSVGAAYYTELTKVGLKVKRIYGATPARERTEIANAFNDGSIDVIVGQMQAMGVAINLQKASNRVLIAQDHFSPSILEQFIARVYRTGQTSTTYVGYLSSNHPLDKAIARIRRHRAKAQSTALD
tara:strand:+ start:10887 stop:12212 length:1326 start_codon:yes stop_codon:yes gene_type:complete